MSGQPGDMVLSMDLHRDMVTEILSRVPVQSLLRFRSVSKLWCNTIDSSAFRKSHFQNQVKNTDKDHKDALLLRFSKKSGRDCELSMFNDNGKSYKLSFLVLQEILRGGIDRLAVIGPVNGLICIYNRVSTNLSIVICNPCLGEIKILPVSPVIHSSWPTHYKIGFGYDYIHKEYKVVPKYCNVGFGYDYITKEYKVVLLTFSKEGEVNVEVYSGTTNTWRKLDTNMFDDKSWKLEMKAINNSAFKVSGIWAHWRTQRQINGSTVEVILSFDVQNEVFKTTFLDFPGSLCRKIFGIYAKDDDSFVVFAQDVSDSSKDLVDIWEGKDGCWTRVENVHDLTSFGIVPPLPPWKRDTVVMSGFDPERFKLFTYDYYKTKGKSLPTLHSFLRSVILEYRCSLISP